MKQKVQATVLTILSRLAANWNTAIICSFFNSGKSARISSFVIPDPSQLKISQTVILVPTIHGFPNRIFGL